jgi:DNA-directed RNA polymerase subunit omega
LYKGAQPLIENKAGNKKIVLGLREVAAGRIDYDIPTRKK